MREWPLLASLFILAILAADALHSMVTSRYEGPRAMCFWRFIALLAVALLIVEAQL